MCKQIPVAFQQTQLHDCQLKDVYVFIFYFFILSLWQPKILKSRNTLTELKNIILMVVHHTEISYNKRNTAFSYFRIEQITRI